MSSRKMPWKEMSEKPRSVWRKISPFLLGGFGGRFAKNSQHVIHEDYIPLKLTYPMKNGSWKTMIPFRGHSFFQGFIKGLFTTIIPY